MLILEAHLLALAFWAAFGGFLGLQWLWQMRAERRFIVPAYVLFYVLGGILPALIFFATHLLPDWGLPSGIALTPQRFDLLRLLPKELSRWNEYIFSYPLEALLTLIAVIYLIRRRDARILLGLLGMSLVAYFFLAPTEWPQYTRYFLPFQALCIGGLFAYHEVTKPALAGVMIAALFGMLFAVLPVFQMTRSLFQKPVPPVVAYVAENIPPGSTVVMNMAYYLSFDRGDRYRYINPGIYPPRIADLGGPPEEEVWSSLKPDIIVMDRTKDEYTPWLERFLQSAHFVKIEHFAADGIEIYVPPSSPIADGA